MLTNHASKRSQQRCISPMLLDLLLQFGTKEKASGGTEKMYFDKSSRRKISAYAGSLAGMLERYLDIYAVIGNEGNVVTVGHRLERVKRS